MNVKQPHLGSLAQTASSNDVTDRTRKSVNLVNSAEEIKHVISHLMDLQHSLGIYDQPEPMAPPPNEMKEPEADNSLVNVLNTLPETIRNDCAKAHNIIEKIQENLL